MNAKPEFYLDTSSVRLGVRRLIERPSPQTFTTSVFTLTELLNGLRESDKEYDRRAGSIRNLLHSPVAVRWSFPETVIASAFPALTEKNDRLNLLFQLSKIVDCVQRAESRSGYVAAISRLGLDDKLVELENYDEVFGRQFIEATVSQKYDIRGAFEREQDKTDSLIPREVLSGTFQSFCDWWIGNPMSVDFVRLALVENYALSSLENFSEVDKERIFDSYDGSTDVFLRAMARRTMGYQKTGGRPARNDAADLAHFAYLQAGMTLVTEDRGMRTVAELIGVQVLSLSEVLNGKFSQFL